MYIPACLAALERRYHCSNVENLSLSMECKTFCAEENGVLVSIKYSGNIHMFFFKYDENSGLNSSRNIVLEDDER